MTQEEFRGNRNEIDDMIKEGMSEIEILDAWLTSEIKEGKEEIKKIERSGMDSLFIV